MCSDAIRKKRVKTVPRTIVSNLVVDSDEVTMGFEIGKTVAGYKIVELLGSSAMGMAYKVRNVFSQRFEILKILPKEISGNEERVVRFLREIKVHARLVHPNIVTFYQCA